MKTVHVDTGRPYDIYIEKGVIDSAGEYAKKLSNAQKVTIITDSNVSKQTMAKMEELGIEVVVAQIAATTKTE